MYCYILLTKYPRKYTLFGVLSMAIFRIPLFFNKKLHFYKLLGCGKNGTFDIHPDWQQWAILLVAEKNNMENIQLEKGQEIDNILHYFSPFIKQYLHFFHCEKLLLQLDPVEGHGTWDGKAAFGNLNRQSEIHNLVAVLTRATIRINRLKNFWKHVNAVADKMASTPGFIFSVGIGEIPWKKQATLSIWKDMESMKSFAYKQKEHVTVIQKTRQENWYKEEQFVRFKPVHCYGTLHGKNPLQNIL